MLLASAWLGWRVRLRLPDHHRRSDTVDAIRVMMTLLVTFAAIVLGLLLTSAKAHYDDHLANLENYSIDLIQLDQRLREYGAETDPARAVLRAYVAAAIAATWPSEPRPSGTYPTHLVAASPGSEESRTLGSMLLDVDRMIGHLTPTGALQQELAPTARSLMQTTLQARWRLVDSARPTISWLFLSGLIAWLVLIFAIFGLSSPANGLTVVVVAITALSLSLSLILILELDTPVRGLLRVSSAPLRDTLAHMDEVVPRLGQEW